MSHAFLGRKVLGDDRGNIELARARYSRNPAERLRVRSAVVEGPFKMLVRLSGRLFLIVHGR